MIIHSTFFASLSLLFTFSASVIAEDYTSQVCHQYSLPAKKADIIGEVRGATNNELLYCEYHIFEDGDPKKTTVEYRKADQTLIATKSIDYSPGLIRPNVIQRDLRHNELRSVVLEPTDNTGINVSYRKPNDSDIKSTQIKPLDNLVVDAGFDEAVREYWYTLIGGEKLIIDFLSPVHLRTIKLSVKKSDARTCFKENYDRDTQACFLIRPLNIVLNLFVKPLALIYERGTKRLLYFKGAVNITNENGGTQSAVIKYYYES